MYRVVRMRAGPVKPQPSMTPPLFSSAAIAAPVEPPCLSVATRSVWPISEWIARLFGERGDASVGSSGGRRCSSTTSTLVSGMSVLRRARGHAFRSHPARHTLHRTSAIACAAAGMTSCTCRGRDGRIQLHPVAGSGGRDLDDRWAMRTGHLACWCAWPARDARPVTFKTARRFLSSPARGGRCRPASAFGGQDHVVLAAETREHTSRSGRAGLLRRR